VIEQVLSDPELTSGRFREWKETHAPLVQEICLQNDQQVAPDDEAPTPDAPAAEAATTEAEAAVAVPLVETSL